MKNLMALPLLALLLAMPVASALTDELLVAAYEDVKCRTDFTANLISDVIAKVPEASYLSGYSTTLKADTDTLYTYVQAGDKAGFRTYLTGTYNPDLRGANAALRDARKNFTGWNVSAQIRKELLDSYKSRHGEYITCHTNAVKKFGLERVSSYKSALGHWSGLAANLSAKGINTVNITNEITGATNTIVIPLENAINSANDSKAVKDALADYCLANGCRNGFNYHFYAKAEHAKLQAILGYIKPGAANYTGQVAFAQSELDEAKRMLDSVGSTQYSDGQGKIIWDSLRDAAKTIRALIKGLRTSSQVAL